MYVVLMGRCRKGKVVEEEREGMCLLKRDWRWMDGWMDDCLKGQERSQRCWQYGNK